MVLIRSSLNFLKKAMNLFSIFVLSVWSCFGFYIGNVLIVPPRENACLILLNLLISPILPLIGLILYLDLFLSEWYFKLWSKTEEFFYNRHRSPSVSHVKENCKTEFMERDEEMGLLS